MDALLRTGLCNALFAAALAVAVALVCRAYRRPALAHGLWLLVLLKLIMPPLVPVALPWPAPAVPTVATLERPVLPEAPAGPVSTAPEAAALEAAGPVEAREPVPSDVTVPGPVAPPVEPAADPQPRTAGVSWTAAVATLWLAGSVLWWGFAGWRVSRFRRLLREARPAPWPLREQTRRLAARLGLTRVPEVALVPFAASPMVWALGGPPRLLLPEALWDWLTEEQQETLLVHELAHLRRRDHWVRLLEFLVLGLYWWHPVVWWARREIQQAEEECCDAWVVWALPAHAPAYAEALLATVTFLCQARSALPLAASGAGHAQLLKRRLTMILRATPPRMLTWGGVFVLLALGVLLLPLLPGWAESPPTTVLVVDDPPAVAAEEPPARDPRSATTPVQPETTAPQVRPPANSWQNPADAREEAREELELLRVQLTAKEAELQEANALLQRAQRQLTRYEQLQKQGAIDVSLYDQARTDVEVQQARVRGKQAQIAEVRVRLAQAERRLARLSAAPTPPTPAVPGTQPLPAVHAVPPAEAHRTTPPLVRAPRRATPPAEQEAGPNEERLRRLEDKVQALLTEMEALRRELRGSGTRPPPAPRFPGQPDQPRAPQFPSDPNTTPPQEYNVIPGPGGAIRVLPSPNPKSDKDPRSTPTVPLAPAGSRP